MGWILKSSLQGSLVVADSISLTSVIVSPSRVRWKLERWTILASRPTATSTASALEARSLGAT